MSKLKSHCIPINKTLCQICSLRKASSWKHARAHTHTHTHTHTYIYIYMNMHRHKHAYIYIYINMHINMHIYIYIYINMHRHAYIYIYIYRHRRKKRKVLPVNLKPHSPTQKNPQDTLTQRRQISVSEAQNHSNACSHTHIRTRTHNAEHIKD